MLFLGIDIGGTKRVVVVGDHSGQLLEHIRKPMENSGDWRADLACLVADGRELVAGWQERTGERLGRVGVSVPGPADTRRGILLNPPNLPNWHNAPIGDVLREAFSVEVRVENDANAAALAEFEFGAGRGCRDMVYLTMSTGVGAGVIADGQLLRGAFGAAGEAGHLPVESPGEKCRCGLSGCLEAYVGGHAWRSRLQRVVPVDSAVYSLAGRDREAVRPEHLIAAARRGDLFACGEFDRWLDYMARGLVPIVMLLEPERIVLGTIPTAAGEALCFEPLRKRVTRLVWPHQSERLDIIATELGDELPQRAGLAVALSGLSMSEGSKSTSDPARSAS
ncbi:MAG: ROK family protein [Myxococcales bacterium]|nr:ROK family protein [Myxococcales bacterium]HIK84442.1 ROK family protein [Myxococcales bacterium]